MGGVRQVRDTALLDVLGSIPARPLTTTLWRITRSDRDPLRSSAPKGRWDDGTIDVLYTSIDADGARAEMYFHIMRGQPVFPSRMKFKLYEIEAKLRRAITLTDKTTLSALGVDMTTFGNLGYARKNEEYTASQRIGEAAHFLDADALVVPNARWDCDNAVLFTARSAPDNLVVRQDLGVVDWAAWKRLGASRS